MAASEDSFVRGVFRSVLVVVAVAVALFVIYLLRGPLSWLLIAAFIAVAVSGPVNLLSRVMKRGLAIALAYGLLVLVPIALGAALIPSIVEQAEDFVDNLPAYVNDVSDFVDENETLASVNEDYDVTGELEDLAKELPSRIGDAAAILRDIGVGVVNSIFTAVTILILSVFMVAGGRRWVNAFLKTQPPDRSERVGRTLDHIASAVGNYCGGALFQATVAGIASYVVLSILGAPFAGALALVVAFFDLIPVVGATIAAVLIAVVMLFVDFPVGVLVWIGFAIVYQQIENYVIQPQIQKRAVAVDPFVVLVAVLFGSTLFGVLGAILAIPTAASLQIAVREWAAYRRESDPLLPDPSTPSAASGGAA
ncbi:AI-2E family transporter [Thermoleophilia bacterium SCSIO 60948]|nr:AI-2E family transporter [Thermoleophilia bacterium SCSIO 60948]